MNPTYRSYDVFRCQKDNGFQEACRVMHRLAGWLLNKLTGLNSGGADTYALWSDLLEIALWSNK